MFTIADVKKQLKIMGFDQHIPDSILQNYIVRLRKNNPGSESSEVPAGGEEQASDKDEKSSDQQTGDKDIYVAYDLEEDSEENTPEKYSRRPRSEEEPGKKIVPVNADESAKPIQNKERPARKKKSLMRKVSSVSHFHNPPKFLIPGDNTREAYPTAKNILVVEKRHAAN